MPRLNHKNIVRYYSSWIEAVEPCVRSITKAVKRTFIHKNQSNRENTEHESEDSLCETTIKVIENEDNILDDELPRSDDEGGSQTDIYSSQSDKITTNESLIDIIYVG